MLQDSVEHELVKEQKRSGPSCGLKLAFVSGHRCDDMLEQGGKLPVGREKTREVLDDVSHELDELIRIRRLRLAINGRLEPFRQFLKRTAE